MKSQQQLRDLQEKAKHYEVQLAGLRESNFEMGLNMQDIENKKIYLNDMVLNLQKKLVRLKKYEKYTLNNLKTVEKCLLNNKSMSNNGSSLRHSAYLLQKS